MTALPHLPPEECERWANWIQHGVDPGVEVREQAAAALRSIPALSGELDAAEQHVTILRSQLGEALAAKEQAEELTALAQHRIEQADAEIAGQIQRHAATMARLTEAERERDEARLAGVSPVGNPGWTSPI